MNTKILEAMQRIEGMAENAVEIGAVEKDLRTIRMFSAPDGEYDPIIHGIHVIAKHALEYAKDAHNRFRVIKNIAGMAQEAPEAVEVDDRQAILEALLPAIQLTRAGDDVTVIRICDNGFAEIEFRTGSRKPVNIDGGSGIAMIVDICRALM